MAGTAVPLGSSISTVWGVPLSQLPAMVSVVSVDAWAPVPSGATATGAPIAGAAGITSRIHCTLASGPVEALPARSVWVSVMS